MSLHSATYYYGEGETSAHVSMLKNKLAIRIGANEEKREVFWYYDQIAREEPTLFVYPGSPKQVLRIHSSKVAEEVAGLVQNSIKVIYKRRGATFFKGLLFLGAAITLFYFFAIPPIAASIAARFPITYEKEMGDQMYRAMQSGFVTDAKRTAALNEFFRQLRIPSSYDIKITVIKGEVANAFAVPGGHIVVYDNLLKKMTSYTELAALLTHEFTHVEKRHSLKALFRQFSSRIFFSLLIGSFDEVSAFLMNHADELKGLSYSRRLETEADEGGARLLAQRKIDCNGFIQLFTLLKKEANSYAQTPELISSHPDLEKRMQAIRQLPYCRQSGPVPQPSLQALFNSLKKE